MSSTISACIIAKDEEKHIGTCLKSLQGVVDEIIVVDTGSTDRTVEIAKSYGAKVYFKKWDNDFSLVRNEALEKATMDYIIYIDCDEYLVGDGWINLRKNLNKRYEGYCLLLANIIDGKKTLAAQTFRIFKNRKNFRFVGKIHEQIIRSILKTYKESDIGFLPIEIYHLGYDEKEYDIEKKKKRNFEIYEVYPEEEKDGFFYYNIAGEYSRAGLKEKALESYIKSYNTEGFDNGFRQYLAIYLTKGLFEARRYSEAIFYSSEFLKKYTDFADLHFLRGTCYYYIGKYSEALAEIKSYEEHKGNVNYPDFKLGESNNLQDILNELRGKSISFSKELISIIVDFREYTGEKSNLIKLNEFSNNVIVISDEEEVLREAKEFLAKPVTNETDIIAEVEKTLYTFYFKHGEFIELPWFMKAIDLINVGQYDILESMALDEEFNVYITSRVVKSELVKKEGISIFEKGNDNNYTMPKDKLMIINK
ncbi:MAG: glycosyltransferase [Clostridium sp.]|uniref:glycosyltransferase family 2 protein n=1 Tax=Clostridium sp. TaxID=1506 RepID=UPI003F39D952